MDFFKNDKLGCRCGKCSGDQTLAPKLYDMMNVTRYYYGKPLYVTSGYRCKLHPKWSENHEGFAVDFHCGDSRHRFELITAMLKAGFTRVGIAKDFIHGDITPNKDQEVIWLY